LNLTPGWILIIAALVLLVVILALVGRSRRRSRGTPTALYIEALDALLIGDDRRAMELLKETVRMDSGNVGAYIKLGTLFRHRGDLARATRIHREVSIRPRIDPAALDLALRELALDYTAQGNTDKALATLEEIRRRDKKQVFAYEAAAQIMEEKKDWERAYEFRKELQKVSGEDGSSLASFQAFVGRELTRKGDFKGAKDHFKEAFRREKHSLPASLYAGDLKYEEGRLEDAIDLWKDVIRHHVEKAPWVYQRLQKAYFDLGRFETMMDVYEEVLKKQPDDARTLFAVARFYRKKGNLEEAERTVSQILAADPEDRLAGIFLALVQAEQGDTQTAVSTLSRQVEKEVEWRENLSCSRCGEKVGEISWRCPKCGAWDSFMKPEP
jgi:lipopolysaccharide biosynthesis regulator YciM